MRTSPLPLIVGVPGLTLTPEQREVLERVRPAGIILFSRNIESPEQVQQLLASLQELQPNPFFCIDLEGGAVNRLAGLWGTLPSPARAAAQGRRALRALGEAAGSACRNLGIHLDFAPVVDLERPSGLLSRQSRCLSDDPERVATLAKVFGQGLDSWCVAGCLKHFPGLGAVVEDTHDELPVLTLGPDELQPHLDAFSHLSQTFPLVMMAHVIVPAISPQQRPASLNRDLVRSAASLPGAPIIICDDLDMGAVTQLGDLPELVVGALVAQNDGVLVCRSFDRLPEIADCIEQELMGDDASSTQVGIIGARLDTLRRDLRDRFAAIPTPDDTTVAQLWEQARREAEP